MKTVRMFCIMVGSVLAAFLVPLAVRAWLASPRPVEAPVMAATWEARQQISKNKYEDDDGMKPYPALAVMSPTVGVAWSRQVGTDENEHYDPYYRSSPESGDPGEWGAGSVSIQSTPPITTETTRMDVAIDSGGGFHFVWSEYTQTPSYTIYYSYTNASSTETITQVNDALATPAIAVYSNQVVHVVWSQGANSIEYNSKNIGPATPWGSSTNITSASMAIQPDIAVEDDGTAHVVWSEGGSSGDIFYKNSSDWSTTLTEVSSDATTNDGRSPAIAVRGNTVYVVWSEVIERGEQYVRFRQSTDGGSNWGSSERISGGALAANQDSPTWLRPAIAVDSNEKIHVAFNGAGAIGDPEDIYYVSKTKDGSWQSRENVTDSSEDNDTTPDIATDNEYVHLIWAGPTGPFDPEGNVYEVLYTRTGIVEEAEGVYLPLILKSS